MDVRCVVTCDVTNGMAVMREEGPGEEKTEGEVRQRRESGASWVCTQVRWSSLAVSPRVYDCVRARGWD